MAWLRVDDGLAEHRKILKLRRQDRWTWMEVLCYVARQGNGGHVPEGVHQVIRYATPAFIEHCHTAGLLDVDPESGEYVVHDWDIYNGRTIDERVAAYLEEHPNASANDVVKAVGGTREVVLDAIRRHKKGGS